jgi:hypothetical protein
MHCPMGTCGNQVKNSMWINTRGGKCNIVGQWKGQVTKSHTCYNSEFGSPQVMRPAIIYIYIYIPRGGLTYPFLSCKSPMGSLSRSVSNSASIGHAGSGATTSTTTYVVVFFLFFCFCFWEIRLLFMLQTMCHIFFSFCVCVCVSNITSLLSNGTPE